jgi:hypothetical protein
MVGHHDKFIRAQFDVLADVRRTKPFCHNNRACRAQLQAAVNDVAKEAFPIMRANGDEICPYPCVIVAA